MKILLFCILVFNTSVFGFYRENEIYIYKGPSEVLKHYEAIHTILSFNGLFTKDEMLFLLDTPELRLHGLKHQCDTFLNRFKPKCNNGMVHHFIKWIKSFFISKTATIENFKKYCDRNEGDILCKHIFKGANVNLLASKFTINFCIDFYKKNSVKYEGIYTGLKKQITAIYGDTY